MLTTAAELYKNEETEKELCSTLDELGKYYM